MKITLNGDPFELPAPLTVSELLSHLQIDPRRVAIEHNLVVIRRNTFDTTRLAEGDQVEIVNFVGGGEWNPVRGGGSSAPPSPSCLKTRRYV